MSPQHSPIVLHGEEIERVTVEFLAERAGINPERIHVYVEFGLLEPCELQQDRLLFPLEALTRLRAIERLRRDVGVNLAGVSIILDLVERVRRLQHELERRHGSAE
jgi:MerR family transcriptional regulator/heat shock protein HspR